MKHGNASSAPVDAIADKVKDFKFKSKKHSPSHTTTVLSDACVDDSAFLDSASPDSFDTTAVDVDGRDEACSKDS
eukprot:5053177-Karenia_brevis.AAC.1